MRLLAPDGRERWSTGLGGTPSTASPGTDAVVVGDLRGGVTVLEPADGSVRWRIRSAPVQDVLDAGGVVVSRTEQAVLGLDPADGRERWRTRGSSGGAPLQARGGAVLAAGVGSPARLLRTADGSVQEQDDDGCDDAALAADRLVVTCGAQVRALGRRPWRYEATTGPRPSLAVDADDDVVVGVVGWGQPETRD